MTRAQGRTYHVTSAFIPPEFFFPPLESQPKPTPPSPAALYRFRWTQTAFEGWLGCLRRVSSTSQLPNWHLGFGPCWDQWFFFFSLNLFFSSSSKCVERAFFTTLFALSLYLFFSPSLSFSLFLSLSVSLTIPSFPFSGWPHSAISISCGCDVSPTQAISSDLSAFFQAIHKNSASTYKRRLCPGAPTSTAPVLQAAAFRPLLLLLGTDKRPEIINIP